MKRRDFMISAGAAAAGMTLLPKTAFAEANRIDWYTSSDQNVLDFWTNIVKPKFEAANPGVTLNLVDAGDGAGLQAIEARALAALAGKNDPQADFFEGAEARLPAGALDAGLYVDFSKENMSNYSKINPLSKDIPQNITYRGSQVLLAYDTTKLPADKAPKTFADLIAWIKANPGQFIYNRPDKGGSGGNFVRRAILEANGRDPSVFKIDNYKPDTGDAMLAKGWDILKDLSPSLMDQGAYTSGNTQSIQLLSQGAVTMIPAWSDQSLSAIKNGVLPDTTGLVQLSDLGLPGGFTHNTVPVNGTNKALAVKLSDFILSEEIQSAVITELGGFPGVSWDYVSKELHDKYKDLIPNSIPVFPGGDWDKAVNDGWYRNVAPNVDRSKWVLAPASDIVGASQKRRRPTGLLLVALPVLLVGWMIIYPILSAVVTTIWQPDADGAYGVSFKTYQFFFSDSYSLANLSLTLWTTFLCAIFLVVICLPIALYLRFAKGPLAAYVQGLAIFPLFVPSIILSYAFIRVLGPNGMVDILLNAVHLPKIRSPYLTPWGPLIGLVWDHIPLTVLILIAGLGAVSDASIEAAKDVGAGPLTRLWYIILPRIRNSILVAVSFSVLGIFSAFTLPYVLGPAAPEMMGPFMQRTFRDLYDPQSAITQAVIAFFFCIAFGLFYVRSVVMNQRGR